jgi:hypothetical protein
MKENVIIGRLIPAGKQYRKINNQATEADELEDQYFDPDEEGVDVSEFHLEEIKKEMEHESDF